MATYQIITYQIAMPIVTASDSQWLMQGRRGFTSSVCVTSSNTRVNCQEQRNAPRANQLAIAQHCYHASSINLQIVFPDFCPLHSSICIATLLSLQAEITPSICSRFWPQDCSGCCTVKARRRRYRHYPIGCLQGSLAQHPFFSDSSRQGHSSLNCSIWRHNRHPLRSSQDTWNRVPSQLS